MGKKHRSHSWRKYTPTEKEWEAGIMQAFKCRRCGMIAFTSPEFLSKINNPRYRYFSNPRVQKFQEYRRKLNNRLNTWVINHHGSFSVDCNMVPVAEIMEC